MFMNLLVQIQLVQVLFMNMFMNLFKFNLFKEQKFGFKTLGNMNIS
jgi:hypothetical protein